MQDIKHSQYRLTELGHSMAGGPSPEVQVFTAVPADGGVPLAAIEQQLGAVGEIGFRQAMALKWVSVDKSGGEPLVVRKVAAVEDSDSR